MYVRSTKIFTVIYLTFHKTPGQNNLSALINIMHYPSTPLWNTIAALDRKKDAVYLGHLACYMLEYSGLVESWGGDTYSQKLITCSHISLVMTLQIKRVRVLP